MNVFVKDGGFTRMVAVLVIALLTLGSGVVLVLLLTGNHTVAPAILATLGTVMGSGLTFFSKASGLSDGASLVQNAIDSVTVPMTTAINATPPTTLLVDGQGHAVQSVGGPSSTTTVYNQGPQVGMPTDQSTPHIG